MWNGILICGLLSMASVASSREYIKIGGLFEEGYRHLEWIFRLAVNEINVDENILPRLKLQATTEIVNKQDAFYSSQKVCEWVENDVRVIFGPQSLRSTIAVQSVAESAGIPLILNRWEYRNRKSDTTVFLHPHADTKGIAFRDFFKVRRWKRFAIIYDDPKALIRLNAMLTDTELQQDELKPDIIVRQIEDRTQYKKLFKDMKTINVKNFLIDIPTEQILYVLGQAEDMDMVGIYYNYFFTSLDVHTLDLKPFQKYSCNITMYRVIDMDNEKYNVISEKLNSSNLYLGESRLYETQFALMYDAVYHFAKALQSRGPFIYYIDLEDLSCSSNKTWKFGNEIIEAMKGTETNGLTGAVKLDENGYRTDFRLMEMRLTKFELKLDGFWNGPDNFTQILNKTADIEESASILAGRKIKVCSVLVGPYFMKGDNYSEENKEFKGYAVDLVKKLAKFANFTNEFYEVPDKSYGKFQGGEWVGMIGELIKGRADIVVADLTVNEERSKVVDFTLPFMNLGISILFKKPGKKDANLFSFLSPFSIQVWFYVATGVLGVTIVMYVMGRFTPYEWTNPHPCDKEPTELENQFTLQETAWLVVGCLMQQGGDITPRATSTRMAIGYWWFFTMIMVSSYTANLAAFLTAGRLEGDIKSAEDLANQQKIQYGCLKDGTTQKFFRNSTDPLHSKMWTTMESTEPSVFVESNKKGQDRVQMGNYAFFMESSTIEYVTSTHCDLTQVGDKLDRKSYAIATQQGSPFREILSQGLLRLSENGEIELLKNEWWRKDKCPPEAPSSDTLGLENIGGVFLILIIGLPIACFAVVLEFYWETRKIPKDQRGPICMELYKELKLTCMGKNTTKTVPPEEEDEEKIISLKKANNSSTSSSFTETPPQ